ncbi:negative elongation factor E-like [Oppia nitens]|uniref:negative elongation factor E-like n=1 Tax=Oppia nitens TaxID=1686743 RepID=UPI0023DCDB2A|nr:negative elongation factor E-like [Oppia nitens]
MVFIQLPTQLTDEEQMLQRKYQKLKRKKKALQALRAPKPEAQPIQQPIKRTSESGTDAKEVAKKLLKLGKIHAIKQPLAKDRQASGFKRSVSLERKRGVGSDRPGGYQPFNQSQSIDDDNAPLENIVSNRVKPLYETFISSRDPETIAREETVREKRRDGKANYVNRDTPQTGNTIYVHGIGINEPTLRTGFSMFGNIMNITVEVDKNCGFVTFDSIECANKAINDMNHKLVNGIKLKVSLARKQPVVNEKKPDISNDTIAHSSSASTVDVWSTIAAKYSQKSDVKSKRSLLSYEETDIFANM